MLVVSSWPSNFPVSKAKTSLCHGGYCLIHPHPSFAGDGVICVIFPLVNPPESTIQVIQHHQGRHFGNRGKPQALDHVRVGDLPSKAGPKKIGRFAHLPDPLYHRGSARVDAALRLGAIAPGGDGR